MIMVKRWRKLLLTAILLLPLVGCDLGFGSDSDKSLQGGYTQAVGDLNSGTQVDMRPGSVAPNFTLATYAGGTLDLRQTAAKNKLTLVNFWATWCADCRAEMPDLEDAYRKYKDNGFAIVGVNIGEDAATVKGYVQPGDELLYTFPVALDQDRAITRLYQLAATPSSFLLDSDGKLVHIQLGPMNARQLEALMQKYIVAGNFAPDPSPTCCAVAVGTNTPDATIISRWTASAQKPIATEPLPVAVETSETGNTK